MSRTTGAHHAGCSKRPFSKAAASEEARLTLRYVEPLSAARPPFGERCVLAHQGWVGEKETFSKHPVREVYNVADRSNYSESLDQE